MSRVWPCCCVPVACIVSVMCCLQCDVVQYFEVSAECWHQTAYVSADRSPVCHAPLRRTSLHLAVCGFRLFHAIKSRHFGTATCYSRDVKTAFLNALQTRFCVLSAARVVLFWVVAPGPCIPCAFPRHCPRVQSTCHVGGANRAGNTVVPCSTCGLLQCHAVLHETSLFQAHCNVSYTGVGVGAVWVCELLIETFE
jgi:hypothetical protein